ncbi:hypothetical protein [Pseudomonas sp. Root569]|uniref:hypothetical protein n=1 Tax=Pseudomonas sp. Root569 TaxID=1736566 RepID=UPI0012E39362|nr:hypothetical protein [Pseudomonas sp. Root569]
MAERPFSYSWSGRETSTAPWEFAEWLAGKYVSHSLAVHAGFEKFCIPGGGGHWRWNFLGKIVVNSVEGQRPSVKNARPGSAKCRMHDGPSCKMHENENRKKL